MTKQIVFNRASEMPDIAISLGDMDWNKTGAWRTQRPYYENKTPPCNAACPAGNDIVAFIQKITQGDPEGAWRLIKEENPFPGICGRVCFHPCESKCHRGNFDEPIVIHALERFVADFSTASLPKNIQKIPKERKEKIAIIGSGPAGMSCAYHLAKLHYGVTVFESLPFAGGMLRMGIPAYRLPKKVVDREISDIEAVGVEIRTGVSIGEKIKMDELRDYQAIFIATGAQRSRGLNVPGEKRRTLRGLDLLKRINLDGKVKLGERVAIIGGGNTAVDVARSVIRLGKKAILLYRRSKEEMPAFKDEIVEALEEGMRIRSLVSPIRIQQKESLKRLECLRMKLGEKDESGRRRPVAVPHSNFFIEADTVVVAVGEEIETSFLPRGIGKREGIVLTQIDGRTDVKGIFAGGDLTSNQRTVAHAIGSGKKASMAIDAYLKESDSGEAIRQNLIGDGPSISIFRYLHPGEGYRNPHVVTFEELNMDYFEPAKREKESKRLPRERMKAFIEVTSGLTESAALREAERCFSCGTCNECENCYLFCPDASVLKRDGILSRQVDYDFCKGCGICFVECPRKAISLEEEAR